LDDHGRGLVLNASLGGPTTETAIDQAVGRLAEGPRVPSISHPYDARGQTSGEDWATVLATVGFDVKPVGATEFEAAQTLTDECEHRVVDLFDHALLDSPLVLRGE
jgi:hypothetical protein